MRTQSSVKQDTPSVTLRSTASSTVYKIDAMDCPAEVQLIRNKLASLTGITDVEVNLVTRKLTVYHTLTDTDAIETALRAIGMPPSKHIDPPAPANKPFASLPLFTAFSGICAIAAEIMAWQTGSEDHWPVITLALLSVLSAGLPTLKKGWAALTHFTLNIYFLMSIAIIGAGCLGQWPEAAMVVFLFSIAQILESRSLEHTRHAIHSLMSLAPEVAWVKDATAHWQQLPVAQIAIDALVLVKPGERIALDGKVIAGNSSVNQAPITGESIPVQKQIGDLVFAGTINEHGSLIYQVTTTRENTTLAHIIHAVENAQAHRAPIQRFIDQFARYYTPVVVLFACLVATIPPLFFNGLWPLWIHKALLLLVIACPCALVLSTPVTLVSGLAAAAKRGILIKGSAYLEKGRKLTRIAVDKTGTLTEGRPRLTDCISLIKDNTDWLNIAARLEEHASHPMATAILTAWQEKHPSTPLAPIEQFALLPGQGVQGIADGQLYLLGNGHLLGVKYPPALESQLSALESAGKTVAILADSTQPLAIFAVADTVRPHSIEAIAQLRALRVTPMILTGDHTQTALAIGNTVDIQDIRANLLPADKRAIIDQLQQQGQCVGMIGDGINDAPALAQADIGFAMGGAGVDTAINVADVVLMDDDLRKLADFIRLSRRTYQFLIQNIVVALSIKLVFFWLALAGYSTLWMAVFADVGASLLVIFNGLRLLGFFNKPIHVSS